MQISIAGPPSEIQKARAFLAAACPYGLTPHFAELRALGIPVDAIFRHTNLCEMYHTRLSHGAISGRCLVIPCLDELEEVVDFLAVELGSGAAATYLGVAAILGLDRLVRPQQPGRVAVHSTPLDWLRSGCDGCCVLNWTQAAETLRRQPVTFLAGSGAVTRMLRGAGVQSKILTQLIRRGHAA